MADDMKKLILITICIIAVLSGAFICEAAKTTAKNETKNRFETPKSDLIVEEEQSKKKKKRNIKSKIKCGITEPMRVAGFVTNPPFGWVNVIPGSGIKQTQYINAGFSYDLFTQLAKNLNLRVSNVGYSSYQDALRDLRKGRIDVIAGVYYDKRVLGTGVNLMFPGYFTNPIIPIFVKGKERPIKSWSDLRGLKGVVRQEEMIYSLVFQQLPKDLQIEQVSGSKKAFSMLLSGEADYMITSLYAAEAEVRRYKLVDEIYFSPKSLVSPELFFVFSSHTDCRLHKKSLSEELKKIKADEKTYMDAFIGYIDDWGQRFKDKPSLIETIRAEREKAAHPELSAENNSDNTDFVESEESLKINPSDLSDTADTIPSDKPDSDTSDKTDTSSGSQSTNTPTQAESESATPATPAPTPNHPLTPAERIKNL